jgi:predicted  nucleic acid-binding Zn-ribbon protein
MRVLIAGIPPLWKGNMDRTRILELALEALEKQRTDVEAAITEIRELRDGNKRKIAGKPDMSAIVALKRRSKTKAERKAQAKRMREYWAAKKLQAAKVSPAGAKRRPKSAAEKKALSLKMKQVWAKRKAEARKKTA